MPHGIVLVTGPTGSGKTTTLYAALSKINDVERKIITIEDPVEYQLRGVNQIQVNTKSGLTFALGLRSILRHDPDVVLVGEIRDPETANIAIQASLTGHLVFSTLHTNDAPGAATRLVDMGVEPYLVSSSVEAVLAQRLVRVICKHCKAGGASTSDYDLFKIEFGNLLPPTLYKGAGCRHCQGTGFRGRRGIFEMMPMTDEVRALVLDRSPRPPIRKVAVKQGMRSLREDGWRLIHQGVTTIDEVLQNTKDESATAGDYSGTDGAVRAGPRREVQLMPTYAYKALDRQGRQTAGTLPADSQAGAFDQLAARGLSPISVNEQGGAAAGRQRRVAAGPAVRLRLRAEATVADKPRRSKHVTPPAATKVSNSALESFTREMANLLAAGLPLSRALACSKREASQAAGEARLGRGARRRRRRHAAGDALAKWPRDLHRRLRRDGPRGRGRRVPARSCSSRSPTSAPASRTSRARSRPRWSTRSCWRAWRARCWCFC